MNFLQHFFCTLALSLSPSGGRGLLALLAEDLRDLQQVLLPKRPDLRLQLLLGLLLDALQSCARAWGGC